MTRRDGLTVPPLEGVVIAIFQALIPRDPDEPHRQATQLELFFDLICVIGIAFLTASLHHAISDGHGLEALPRFLFHFVGIWWIWTNFTWFASAFDNDDVGYRLLVILMMCGGVVYAGGVETLMEENTYGLSVIGWIIMRVALIWLWIRAGRNSEALRPTARIYAIGLAGVQSLWVLSYFLVPPDAGWFFLSVVFIYAMELLVPVLAERAKQTPWHRHHIIERYGLLYIVVLGEVILSIALVFAKMHAGMVTPQLLGLALSGLAIVFSLWWLYFMERDHLASHSFGNALLWGYLHVFIYGSAALTGAGLAVALDVATDHAVIGMDRAALWIGLPATLSVFALWLARDVFQPMGRAKFALPLIALALLAVTVFVREPWAIAAVLVLAVAVRYPFENSVAEPKPPSS